MRRILTILIPFFIIAAGAAALLYFSSFKEKPPRRVPEQPVKAVATTAVRLSDTTAAVSAYGRLRSARPVMLYSEVRGRVERGDIPFQPGQAFKRGDLIVKIDDRQTVLDIKTSVSELLTALASVLPEIRVDFPEEYRVWQDYFNSCSFDASVPDLPQAANQKIKLYLSRFNVYKIYFTIRDLEVLHEKHFFYAPFDGSVSAADLRVGSNANAGSRLGEIISLESLEAEMPVPAEDVRWIRAGMTVNIFSDEMPGTWQGRVKRIGKTIDTRTQTVQIYIVLDDTGDERLYDGMFVKAEIPGRTIPDACAVPRRALYEGRYVYLVSNGQLEYREITIARREADHVIVSGGLHNGELLVTEMLQGVAPGMRARPRSALPGESRP